MTYEVKIEATKAAPAVVVATGVNYVEKVADKVEILTWADRVAIATICYIALQAGFLAWKWFTQWSDRRLKKMAAKP